MALSPSVIMDALRIHIDASPARLTSHNLRRKEGKAKIFAYLVDNVYTPSHSVSGGVC